MTSLGLGRSYLVKAQKRLKPASPSCSLPSASDQTSAFSSSFAPYAGRRTCLGPGWLIRYPGTQDGTSGHDIASSKTPLHGWRLSSYGGGRYPGRGRPIATDWRASLEGARASSAARAPFLCMETDRYRLEMRQEEARGSNRALIGPTTSARRADRCRSPSHPRGAAVLSGALALQAQHFRVWHRLRGDPRSRGAPCTSGQLRR